MAQFQEFTNSDVHVRQISKGAHSQDTPSSSAEVTHPRCRIVSCQVSKLRPHPSYSRLGMKISASRLNALLEMGEDAFLLPLVVTSAGVVIDGYCRLEVARLQGRTTIECFEYDLSEDEALRWLLLCHRPSPGFEPFTRIAMARDLAISLRQKALQHQQAGGKSKGASKLTEAERLEVRKKIALVAGVSVGTLSHALEVLKTGDTEILRALYNGEIKIDRAWRWSKESCLRQRDNLKLYKRRRGMERIAQKLVARQLKKLKSQPRLASRWKNATLGETVAALGSLAQMLSHVDVIIVKSPASILALSEDLAQHLGFRQEVLPCP